MESEENIRLNLASNIKRYRIINRLSQEELAERIDISANFLSSIEIGKKWVSPHTLAKLSNALNIPSFELFKPQNAISPDALRHTDEIFQSIKDAINTLQAMYHEQSEKSLKAEEIIIKGSEPESRKQ
ncbi:MAG: helix-turn-helix domain-containing protein [Spirochaetales bacterium]|jgi:transcriptional regulator with XRE-family HTH domain|nr:helix-turn-helix domain-containing protein [Spirochaetales bacterium]